MANAFYPIWYDAIVQASSNSALNGSGTTGVYCALVDTGTYTYSAAHDFYNDLTGIVGTDQEITSKTFGTVASGVFDGADITYTAVSGASVEALVFYVKNAGANSTWRLLFFEDTGVTGLPVTPNGGNISVAWSASGIVKFSDERLKVDIREIGTVGILSLCEYRYRDSRKREIGLIAQDVERKVPSAVVQLGSRKAVDYGRAIGLALAA